MRPDQIDTLIDQLEDYVKSLIHTEYARSKGLDQMALANEMILSNMRTSLKEYISQLAGINTVNNQDYECPDCGSKMIQRKNRKDGNIFYGCVKYPDCKGTRDENGLSKDDKAKAKEVEQQNGFAFNKSRQPWNESGP